MSEREPFIYVLNRYDAAAQADNPFEAGYPAARAELFAYVAGLQSALRPPVCGTCKGDRRILHIYERPPGPPGNAWMPCPNCTQGAGVGAGPSQPPAADEVVVQRGIFDYALGTVGGKYPYLGFTGDAETLGALNGAEVELVVRPVRPTAARGESPAGEGGR